MAKKKESWAQKYWWVIAILLLLLLVKCNNDNNLLNNGANNGLSNSGGNVGGDDLQAPTLQKGCQATANQYGYYYKEPITIAKDGTFTSCYGWSSQDCVDKGKVMSAYGLTGTCCLYTCEAVNNNQDEDDGQTCVDSDGGQDDQNFIYGTCESSVTQSGTYDMCDPEGSTRLREQYCDSDKTCKTSYTSCVDGYICSQGKCVPPNNNQPNMQPCLTIYNPTALTCAAGICGDGQVCQYFPAHLSIPEHCGCTTWV